MELFNLAVRTFDINAYINDDSTWFPFSSISFDSAQVKEFKFASYNKKDGRFTVYYDVYTEQWLLAVSTEVDTIEGDAQRFSVPIYFEYIDADGVARNTMIEYAVYGIDSEGSVPTIKYIENLATEVGKSAEVVLHGKNLNSDLGIFLETYSGTERKCVKVDPDSIEWDLENDTATFTVFPGMLATDADGNEECGTFPIYLGYGECESVAPLANSPDTRNLSLIRYKFSSVNDDAALNTTAAFSPENKCYTTSDMSLVYDDTDDAGNPVANAASGEYGSTVYVRVKPGQNCEDIKYYLIKLKYNTNLRSKYGEKYLDGVYLHQGDIVWLSNQFNEAENGLWIVSTTDWVGLGNSDEETEVCSFNQTPLPVDDNVFIDLGARLKYNVDYSCAQDVPVKYGPQVACSYSLKPGDVVALTNQSDGGNGIWLVTCSWWSYLGPFDGITGTTLDLSSSIIVQNDIDFCSCGGIFHIDYFYLNPTCYLTHLRRTVKVMCAGASIAPNTENQFILTEYLVRTGEEDSLVGNNGRTPGDPVKEDCVKENTDTIADEGFGIIETRPDDYDYTVIEAPDCSTWCDMPRYYNIKMPPGYVSSNDANGFTILFWQYGLGGWHLYAYIGSGNQLTGMNYYVYHLHVNGYASTRLVDINHGMWFTENDGVIADGFGLVDDSWEFAITDEDGRIIDTTHILSDNYLYQQWRIKCTTTFLAHRMYDEAETDMNMRRTCADMDDAAKTELAKEYIVGMEHVYGFNYFKHVMSLDEFCKYYNSFNSGCVYHEIMEVLGTDIGTPDHDEEPFNVGSDDEDPTYLKK